MQISEDQAKEMTSAGLNLIAQALSIFDHRLQLVLGNAPYQRMFDLPDTLMAPGTTFEQTIRYLVTQGEYGAVDDQDAFIKERVDQALTFEPHYIERTRANGRTISIEGSPLPQGGWVAVYTDISATKQQEALLNARSDALSGQLLAHTDALSASNRELAAMITTLEETKRQLTASEARTRLTTQMMPAHIAHVTAEGHYTFSNNRLPDVLPQSPGDIIGLHIREALGAHAFSNIRASLDAAYRGVPSVAEFTEEVSARHVRAAFTPDGQGGVYILSMDITKETQTRNALQQTRKRELAAHMISGLAHDFSNLLTIILGMQSRLSRLPDLPPEAGELIEGTRAAARRGGALLSSIADVTGPRQLRPVACDPATLLQDLATLARPSLPLDVILHTDNQMPDTPVLLDKGLVSDGLLNLIFNARDACGAAGDITLSQRRVHRTWIEWTVTDTGPGFSDSALKKAVDPFFTTKGSDGTGLGLSMVDDMTKMAGGDLCLGNQPSGGACVTLRLPYHAALASPSGLVLLVEDDSDLRSGIRDMLIDLGHSVIEAVSAPEATALLADLPDIVLILSDIQLVGEATGLDLAQNIGASHPLILMTSLPQDNALFQQGQQLAPVLRKPFTQSDLAQLIHPGSVAAQ